MLALADLREDSRFFAGFLEPLHGVLERLAILDAHSRHAGLASSLLWVGGSPVGAAAKQ
jgi:hypothetical protein